MNRLGFFKEMKNGFVKTISSLYEPVVEEEISKIQQATDQVLGLHWFFLLKEKSTGEGIDLKFIQGNPVMIVYSQEKMKAYSGICPFCSQLLQVLHQHLICRCLLCEKDLQLTSLISEENALKEFPLKKKQDGYYVALNKETR